MSEVAGQIAEQSTEQTPEQVAEAAVKRTRRKTGEAPPSQERQAIHDSVVRIADLARDLVVARAERGRLAFRLDALTGTIEALASQHAEELQRHLGLLNGLLAPQSAEQAATEP